MEDSITSASINTLGQKDFLYGRIEVRAQIPSALGTWPFDKPHYLLLNLAYDGSRGGNEGVDTSLLPVQYKIDYVRYYKPAQ